METRYLVVHCACPDESVALRLAREAVEGRLAACARVHPCRSVFRWNGEVRDESEWLLVLKTTVARWRQLETRLRALHPYAVPEIIGMPVLAGSAPYLEWLEAETVDE